MSSLPSYLAAAKPVPAANRAPWYKTIAPTYAGIMLWFVFWSESVKGEGTPGGVLSAGLGPALSGLILAALICHFFYYLVPGHAGHENGLSAVRGGHVDLRSQGRAVHARLAHGTAAIRLARRERLRRVEGALRMFNIGMRVLPTGAKEVVVPGVAHGIIAAAFAVIAAFIALKGIQYVARVATYLPLIPLVVMLVLLAKTCGGLGSFDAAKVVGAKPPERPRSPLRRPRRPRWPVLPPHRLRRGSDWRDVHLRGGVLCHRRGGRDRHRLQQPQ